MKLECIEISSDEYRPFYFMLKDRWEEQDGFYIPPSIIGKVEHLFVFLDPKQNNIVGFFSIYFKRYKESIPYSSVYILKEYRGKRLLEVMYNLAMIDSDYDYLFAIVDKENKVSKKAHSKLGLVYTQNKAYGKTTFLIERSNA